MQKVILNLYISADEYLKVYKGTGRNVYARDINGRSVQFPANILKGFVTREGIQGRFEICFSDEGKFLAITQVA